MLQVYDMNNSTIIGHGIVHNFLWNSLAFSLYSHRWLSIQQFFLTFTVAILEVYNEKGLVYHTVNYTDSYAWIIADKANIRPVYYTVNYTDYYMNDS